jgi:hypothetical protein
MPKGHIIPEDIRRRVVNLWLTGVSYQTISEKTAISEASISKIVTSARTNDPNLQTLRDLASRLKKSNVSWHDVLRGVGIINEFNSLNVSLEDLPPITAFCRATENPIEAAKAGQHLVALEKKTGKSHMQLLETHETLSQRIGTMSDQLKTSGTDLQAVVQKIGNAKRLERLQKKLRKIGLSPERLERYVQDTRAIEANGFTPLVSKILADELRRHGLDPGNAGQAMVALIVQHNGLSQAVTARRKELGDVDRQHTEATNTAHILTGKNEALQATIARGERRVLELKNEATALENSTRERTQTLNHEYERRSNQLQKNLDALQLEETGLVRRKTVLFGDIEALTGLKGDIRNHIAYVTALKAQITSLHSTKKDLEVDTQAQHGRLELTDAWRAFLLTGQIPDWDSSFWEDIETLGKIRAGLLPPSQYLAPTSKRLRKRLVELYKELVSDDVVTVFEHEQLRDDYESLQEQYKLRGRKLSTARRNTTELKRQIAALDDKVQGRIEEEVANNLNVRLSTKLCTHCDARFWVDVSVTKPSYSDYGCPYCHLTFGIKDYPYTIYPLGEKTVIASIIPNQQADDILVTTAYERVAICTRDGAHHITVPLNGFGMPMILEKRYKAEMLALTVQRGAPPQYVPVKNADS